MKLREWDWDKQNFVEQDYPDGPIVSFVNWLRTTKAWHQDPELVHVQLRRLNQTFSAHRQAIVEAAVATAKNMRTDAEEQRREKNKRNLQTAREAQAKRRLEQKAAKALSPDGELPRDL